MRVTLSDIAKKIGVSPSTIQRALNGLEGVGPEKRIEIQKVADEMGYKRNFLASSLKKGGNTIALVLPEPTHNNRYYAHYLWEGAHRYLSEFTQFHLEAFDFPYERKSECLSAKLEEVLVLHGDKIDGILTMGTNDPSVLDVLKKIKEKGIPVVLVGTDADVDSRLCCVRTHDEMAGRMAANLLINFGSYKRYSTFVLVGDFTIPDQFYNALGFEKYIIENKCPFETVKLANDSDLNIVKEGIKNIMNSGLDICAIYSCSARNTVPMCQAVIEAERIGRLHLIGSDIFPESIAFIRNGVLNAIIHKRPSVQAFTAMQTLIDYVLKGSTPKTDTILVDSMIVVKSNLDCYT